MLNLKGLKDKFFELMIDMRDSDELTDFDIEEHEDLRILLNLFDDTKLRLAVLAKMREEGLISL